LNTIIPIPALKSNDALKYTKESRIIEYLKINLLQKQINSSLNDDSARIQFDFEEVLTAMYTLTCNSDPKVVGLTDDGIINLLQQGIEGGVIINCDGYWGQKENVEIYMKNYGGLNYIRNTLEPVTEVEQLSQGLVVTSKEAVIQDINPIPQPETIPQPNSKSTANVESKSPNTPTEGYPQYLQKITNFLKRYDIQINNICLYKEENHPDFYKPINIVNAIAESTKCNGILNPTELNELDDIFMKGSEYGLFEPPPGSPVVYINSNIERILNNKRSN